MKRRQKRQKKVPKDSRRKGKYFHHFLNRTPCGWQTEQEACIMNFRFSSRRVQVSCSFLASETFSHVILAKKVSQIKLRRLIYHRILKSWILLSEVRAVFFSEEPTQKSGSECNMKLLRLWKNIFRFV